MRPARIVTIPWLVIVVPALALSTISAMAHGDDHGTTSAEGATPPLSGKYADACSQGNASYAARDFPGAIGYYKRAIELDPKKPLGHYLLGEAYLAAGSVAEAEASWNRASLESGEKDPAMHVRILFVLADLKERQWKWDDAQAAWRRYLDWTNRFPSAAGFPASARSRQQVIDAMLKQDKASEVVRRRIAETNDGGVFTDLTKTPAVGAE